MCCNAACMKLLTASLSECVNYWSQSSDLFPTYIVVSKGLHLTISWLHRHCWQHSSSNSRPSCRPIIRLHYVATTNPNTSSRADTRQPDHWGPKCEMTVGLGSTTLRAFNNNLKTFLYLRPGTLFSQCCAAPQMCFTCI